MKCTCILSKTLCAMLCCALSIPLQAHALAPRSSLSSDGASENISLEALIARKTMTLIQQGHSPFLARLWAEKQISAAQKALLVITRALDDPGYLFHTPRYMAQLESAASFFGIPTSALAKTLKIPITQGHLLHVTRAFWWWGKNAKKGAKLLAEQGEEGIENVGILEEMPLPENIPTDQTMENFWRDCVAWQRTYRPTLEARTNEWLDHNAKTREQVMEEAARIFGYFLYSKTYATELYQHLTALMASWNIPIPMIQAAWMSQRTERQKSLIQEIEAEGAITYSRYMELALYHGKFGYYTRPREQSMVGKPAVDMGYEFITLPESFPEFAQWTARDLQVWWETMKRPKDFDIIETGSREGTWAAGILAAVNGKAMQGARGDWAQFFQSLLYTSVEISQEALGKQQSKLGKLATRLRTKQGSAIEIDTLFKPNSVRGVAISNELPDAFPVHKVKYENGVLREVFVIVSNGLLTEVLQDPSTPALADHLAQRGIRLLEGEERTINLAENRWITGLAKCLNAGAIVNFDYGFSTADNRVNRDMHSLFRCYGMIKREHQLNYLSIEDAKVKMASWEAATVTPKGNESELLPATDDILRIDKDLEIIQESINNPLSDTGEVDITTDADFESEFYVASRLGLRQSFFGSPLEYFFLRLNVDPKITKRIPRVAASLLTDTKVLVLTKLPPFSPASKTIPPTGAYDLLLRKTTIETAEDLRVFLDFLEEKDFAGLGNVAHSFKRASSDRGVPLVGISPECLFFLEEKGENHTDEVLFSDSDAFWRLDQIPMRISLQRGLSLSHVITILLACAPTDALPVVLQKPFEKCRKRPAQANGVFGSLYEKVFHRRMMEEAIGKWFGAKFFLELSGMGYSLEGFGASRVTLETLIRQGIDKAQENFMGLEPARTLNQLASLRLAFELTRQGENPITQSLWRTNAITEEEWHTMIHAMRKIGMDAAGISREEWLRFLLDRAPAKTHDAVKNLLADKPVSNAVRAKEFFLAAMLNMVDAMKPSPVNLVSGEEGVNSCL